MDMGAQLSLIAKTEADRLGVSWKTQSVQGRVETADGGAMNILGMANILMNYETGVRSEQVFVAHPLSHPIILGLPWLKTHTPLINWEDLSLTLSSGEVWVLDNGQSRAKALRHVEELGQENASEEALQLWAVLVSGCSDNRVSQIREEESSVEEAMKPVLAEFEDIFTALTGIPPEDRIQHHIDLVDGAKPVMKRPYRLAEAQQKEVERQILVALQEGWIQLSFLPWGTAIFVVAKKNREWRMCVDYRDLNALTE